ncbi:pyruvate/2-oxoglutarate/acetoin dehydrogenase complex, dehydrogenase (E1) component [Desulfuromonas soudanensis]|uniref:Pyruvate/2-oxoglutarate/acetoin dehydrogenase complex, dehydrogenase (E1) component n=1 Tax=Desulfuromonas soudanensis TaxID=1603606 RepID=A0A0M5ILG5_9BACT|nr:alpha-ketoacid dehydrogenase subunit beta [Desulfuromonas soudanensis]ALC17518.1 pyruvate/2-oxoglutarate/acetoin dehydrogenase complex, dehydrogenase (E1) component [Desulfuromonas soudanensis]
MPEITCREALNQALHEEMERDETVFVLGEDVGLYEGSFKVTKGLLAKFGDKRVIDTPISEAGIVGMACGAAMTGLRPIVELMTINFSIVALDQIMNHAAVARYMFGGQVAVPLTIRTPGGAGHQLGAQHSHSLEALFLHCPGLRVIVPSVPADAKGLLKSAIRSQDPVMFIEHEGLYAVKGEVPAGEYTIPLGRADIKREGRDLTLVTLSRMVYVCLEAAEELAKEGIEVEVLDLRALNPLDMKAVLDSVRKTRRAVTVEESWLTGGWGGEIAARIMEEAFDDLDAPVLRVGGADVPMPYNKALEKAAIPDAAQVAARVRELF